MGSFVPVYVIDDDNGMLESTQFLLRALGASVTGYSDPLAFLQAVSSLPPGCVLTDFRMPSMSGIELHSALKCKGVDWPVVLMSGHADFEIISRESDDRIIALLEKPFTTERLKAVLEEAGEFAKRGPQAKACPARSG